MITNKIHVLPLKGEDYQVWELDGPGKNTFGANCTKIGSKPTASWWSLNNGWSYQPWNHSVRSAKGILETYRRVRSKGAVFVLNVRPRRFGDIRPEEQSTLRELQPWYLPGLCAEAVLGVC